MAETQFDLPQLARAIADAYDASNNLAIDASLRRRFQVDADALSSRFDPLSGRRFDDGAAAFDAASKTLGQSLDALRRPLDDAANATNALATLKALTGALDALLALFG